MGEIRQIIKNNRTNINSNESCLYLCLLVLSSEIFTGMVIFYPLGLFFAIKLTVIAQRMLLSLFYLFITKI